jgi:hypothetical protein
MELFAYNHTINQRFSEIRHKRSSKRSLRPLSYLGRQLRHPVFWRTHLLGYNAMQFVGGQTTLRKNMSPSSFASNKPRKIPAWTRVASLLRDDMFLRNVGWLQLTTHRYIREDTSLIITAMRIPNPTSGISALQITVKAILSLSFSLIKHHAMKTYGERSTAAALLNSAASN